MIMDQSQLWKIIAAGPTPFGPEVEHHYLAAQRLPGQRLAMEPCRIFRKLGRRLADQRLNRLLPCLPLLVAHLRGGLNGKILRGRYFKRTLLLLHERTEEARLLIADLDLDARRRHNVVEETFIDLRPGLDGYDLVHATPVQDEPPLHHIHVMEREMRGMKRIPDARRDFAKII